MYVRTYVRTYIRTYVRTYVRTYLCIYVSMYLCIYLRMCVRMMNIYRTKIKLHAAANQAIYLVIFYRVVGSLCLNWYIYSILFLFLREWSGHSRYMPVNLF